MRSLLAVLAALLLPGFVAVPTPASGQLAGVSVTVADMTFAPGRVTVDLGRTVSWTFEDSTSHTATSDDGFFDTGAASGGASRSVRFGSAGTFAYHCTFHPMMVGRVRVPMAATGSVEDGWQLHWLVGTSPKGRTYDVQVRRRGATTWRELRKATSRGAGRFDPGAGAWQARARTVKGMMRSGWSPVLPLA